MVSWNLYFINNYKFLVHCDFSNLQIRKPVSNLCVEGLDVLGIFNAGLMLFSFKRVNQI